VADAARRALAESTTPGLAVALVCHGRTSWAAGYGVADQAKGQPVTPATRFQAASVSKPVTAWGVLRLVEQGRIGLDEPVVGHLRRWCPPPSPFKAEAITVRRLLSHTAGLSGPQQVQMVRRGSDFLSRIPGAYTDSAYPLAYFFIVHHPGGDAWIMPGLDDDLANQPYHVIRQVPSRTQRTHSV